MTSYTFTNGFLVLVEGDKKDKTEEITSLQSRIKKLDQIKNKNSKQIRELTALLNQQTKLLSQLQQKNENI